MFCNILKRISWQQQLHCCNNLQLNRNVVENSIKQWRILSTTAISSTTKGDTTTTNTDSEIEAALEIEAKLFDNSSLTHKPIAAAELLREAKRQHQQQQRSQISTTTYKKTAVKNVHVPKELKIIDDPELGLQFVRLALKDPLLSTLMTSVRSRRRRDKDQQIILEGRRLIQEALQCGLRMHTLIFSQTDQLHLLKDEVAQAQRAMQSKIYKIAHHDLKTWSTLSTPPGLLAIFKRPSSTNGVMASAQKSALPITVVCDNIREPNNLGSIIRTCAAIPCAKVVVTRGCCDPWDSKALRGGCGGHFRMPIVDDVDWENMPFLIPPETADNCCVFIAENNMEKLPDKAVAVDYTALECTDAHNVVIIGGESHGVSVDAYKFLKTVGDRGKYLNIPLANGVESLNVASALTLILYELKKHLKEPEVQKVP